MASAGRSESSMITALLEGHWYDAVGALLVDTEDFVQAQRLAAAARRVLELDAEDFTGVARGFKAPWAGRLAASSFPADPQDPIRGALASLVPLYELMLEVLQVRAIRREPLQVVVTAHLGRPKGAPVQRVHKKHRPCTTEILRARNGGFDARFPESRGWLSVLILPRLFQGRR